MTRHQIPARKVDRKRRDPMSENRGLREEKAWLKQPLG